eukprot:TRINITY_DN44967_c0_g1_i1.p1 TRINITY_DN44967_c0_g1~~TRINITY_DN44967_c0_g1_i1.p1  ORF type:complete len:257 (-),score=27.68 TRINITY_DN44967_c0_g1_i1:163-933(-)
MASPPLQQSASSPALGGVASPLSKAGRYSLGEDPSTMSAPKRLAFEAARKTTLQGIVGTTNRIREVVQYPVGKNGGGSVRSCFGNRDRPVLGRLSAEDRKILRVRVKHTCRQHRGTELFAETVDLVEKALFRGFRDDAQFMQNFFMNEEFATKTLLKTMVAVDHGIACQTVPKKKPADLHCQHSVIPGSHGPHCSPQCYCMKLQDAPLSLKADMERTHPNVWQDSFARRTTNAAQSVADHAGETAAATLGQRRGVV